MQTAQINRGLHIKSSCALHRELFLNITIMSRNLLHLPTSVNSHQDTVSHILVVHQWQVCLMHNLIRMGPSVNKCIIYIDHLPVKTFYLATVEGDQPHVRPFGAVCEFEGKLYIVTNNKKDVYNQMKVNGKVEMCGMNKGTWIRVKGAVKEDTRREARVAMMEANKNALQSMYTVDDNLMTVFVFESVIATIYSFTEEPKVINL